MTITESESLMVLTPLADWPQYSTAILTDITHSVQHVCTGNLPENKQTDRQN